MNNELLYQIALTQIPYVGDVHAKTLISVFQEASAVFKARKRHLEKVEGIGRVRASLIKAFNDFSECEGEIACIENDKISPL